MLKDISRRLTSMAIAGLLVFQMGGGYSVLAEEPAESNAVTITSDAAVDTGEAVQVDAATHETAAQSEDASSEILEDAKVSTAESAAADSTDEISPTEDQVADPDTIYTVTIDPAGGILPKEWIETANSNHMPGAAEGTVSVTEENGILTVKARGLLQLVLMSPTPADDTQHFDSWQESEGSHYDNESNTLVFDSSVTEYTLTATYASVEDESKLVENARTFKEQESARNSEIFLFSMDPYEPYTYMDLVLEGLEYVYEDGQIQTFTAPYDGEYIITAYGANGGTGYAKYAGYGVPGRGGMTEATVNLKQGQTIYLYLGEAGGDWSTERTFGGGGAGVDLDHAWIGYDDNSLHVFGRGGGATYVSIDEFDIANAGQAQWDFTDEQKAQNDAAAAVAKKHIIMVAAGGGGAGEMGSPYSHYGLPGGGYEGGILRHHNQYYLPMEQVGQVSYDATVGGRTLTREERLEAWIWPATQTRAGYGLHYSILGNLYDPNPANKDPIELLYPEREARNWGSFFFGSNAMACTGAGGGGWFGGGTDYSFDGGGGSSYIGTSLTNADGSTMTISNPVTEAGANVKYDDTKSSPFYVNGRVLIRLNGTTPELDVVLQEAANEEGSKDNIDLNDVYGQRLVMDKEKDIAEDTATYTAIIYYNLPEIMTVVPSWNYSTFLNRALSKWDDAVAKQIDSRTQVSITNTELGVLQPGDKYYREEYKDYTALKSVMTITNPAKSMYDTKSLTRYDFSCSASASYTSSAGINTIKDTSLDGELVIFTGEYNITDGGGTGGTPELEHELYLHHNGVHVYENENIINGQTTQTIEDTVQATANKDFSVWEYPELELVDNKSINTVLVQFSGYNFDTRDSIQYDANLAESLGISSTQNPYSCVFRAKTENSVSTDTWEKFLRSIKFTTYDAAEFTTTGVNGGVEVFWYADEVLWDSNMFYDSYSQHFYALVENGFPISWDSARAAATSMYNSVTDSYGYLVHITSQEESDFLKTMMGREKGWMGAKRRVSSNEWDWYWVDGPEEETTKPFFHQNEDSTGGQLLWGFENFSDGEPNNSIIWGETVGEEYYLHYYDDGTWNDLNGFNRDNENYQVVNYIVEWNGDGLVGKTGVSDTDIIGTRVEKTYVEAPDLPDISGVVWAENDHNGIYAFGEEPAMEGVEVALVLKTGQVLQKVTTSSSGQYVFPEVSTGEYYLRFTVPGGTIPDDHEVTLKVLGKDGSVTNTVNDTYRSDVFTVKNGEPVDSINCGIFIPSSISGYVWDDTNKDGIYDDGEKKLEGLNVELQLNGTTATDADGNPLKTTTNGNGEYVFTDVPSSMTAYDIIITGSDAVDISKATVSPIPAKDTPTEKANAASQISMGDISATVGLEKAAITNLYIKTVGKDFKAVDLTYKNCALYVRNSIYGYVWAETDRNGILDGASVAEATDNLLPNIKVVLVTKDGEEVKETISSKGGYYEFTGVEPGDYYVKFYAGEDFDGNGKIDAANSLVAFRESVLPKQDENQGKIINGAVGENFITSQNDVPKPQNFNSGVVKIKAASIVGNSQEAIQNVNAALFVPSSIFGKAWEDYNQDGIYQDTEEYLNGVKVSLYKYVSGDVDAESSYEPVQMGNNKPATIQTNQWVDLLTGEIKEYTGTDGIYDFRNLPSGTYMVKFESGDLDLRYYIASPVGNDSDGTATYIDNGEEFSHSTCTNVVIPEQKDQDKYGFREELWQGLYQKLRDVTVTKQIKAEEINWAYGEPTFLISVYGTDPLGQEHAFTHLFAFDKDYVKQNTDENGMVSISYLFEGIPYAHVYNVKEVDNTRYAPQQVSGSENVTVKDNVAAIDLKYEVKGSVTFANAIGPNNKGTSHNDAAVNKFKASLQDMISTLFN